MYTGQTKVALLETETHVNPTVNPYPLESYIGRPGAVWAVIFHNGVIIDCPTPATQIGLSNSIRS